MRAACIPTERVGKIGASARVFLRLERQAHEVRALCSPDGEQWFSLGQASFPASTPVEVGLHAIGWIDRIFYPGAYPEGTAIRFESFQLWQRGRRRGAAL